MHPRSCRCAECVVVGREEKKAGQEIYSFFSLGNYRRGFREVNRMWIAAIKEERWETVDPGQSERIESRWNAAPDSTKAKIKEMCDVVLS